MFHRIGFLLLCAVTIYVSHARLDRTVSDLTASNFPDMILPTPAAARLASLGFDQVVADYFWLQFITYIGNTEERTKDDCALAETYLRLITELDPNFIEPYWFVAFVLGGDRNDSESAAEILEFGIAANPDSWKLPFIAGINQYLYAYDDAKASMYYRMAARFPEAPSWLERQARIIESGAPRLIKEAYSWLNVYENSTDKHVKIQAKDRCVGLWIQVYKTAPTDSFRERAKGILASFGIEVSMFANPKQ